MDDVVRGPSYFWFTLHVKMDVRIFIVSHSLGRKYLLSIVVEFSETRRKYGETYTSSEPICKWEIYVQL